MANENQNQYAEGHACECSPEDLVTASAHSGFYGSNIKTEHEHLKDSSAESTAKFERILNGKVEKQTVANKTVREQAVNKLLTEQGIGDSWIRNVASGAPNAKKLVSQKIYSGVAKNLDNWLKDNQKKPFAEAAAEYKRTIVPGVKNILGKIDEIYLEHGPQSENYDRHVLKQELAKWGVNENNIYYTRKWLQWLSKGGAHFNFDTPPLSNKALWSIKKIVRGGVKGLVVMNPRIFIAHTLEILPRSLAYYPDHTLAGIMDLHNATGGKIWQKIPEIENGGHYGELSWTEERKGWPDLLPAFQRISENLGYFVGKRAGDIEGGMHNIAFKDKPYNASAYFWHTSDDNLFTLMRYHLTATKWYGSMLKNAVWGENKARNLQALAAFSAGKAILTGSFSMTPVPLTGVVNKKEMDEFDDKYGLNIIRHATEPIVPGGINLGPHSRPLGGVALGVGFDIWNNLIKADLLAFKKMGDGIHEKDATKTVLNGVDAMAGLLQMLPMEQYIKFAGEIPAVEKSGAFQKTKELIDKVPAKYRYAVEENLPMSIRKVEQSFKDATLKGLNFDQWRVYLSEKLFGKESVTKK